MAFNGRFVLSIIQYAANAGCDYEELIQLSHTTEADLCKEDTTLSGDLYDQVMNEIIHQTKDELVGLHIGTSMNLSAAGLIGQITQTSGTIKQALEYCCEFANLGCSSLPMRLIEEKDWYKVVIEPDPIWPKTSYASYRQTADGVIAFTIREFRSLTLRKQNPIKISLPWLNTAQESDYMQILGCEVQLGADEIAIYLDKKHVESSIISADYELLRVLVEHANRKSSQIYANQGFKELTKQTLLRLIDPQFPSIKTVAQQLNMSDRSLQRRLTEEKTSFIQITNELRFDLAKSYLKSSELSIKEIAYLLDYNEPSGFTRSFKRWSGITPNEYKTTYIN